MRKIKILKIGIMMFLATQFVLSDSKAEVSTNSPFILPEYSKTISMDFRDTPLTDVLKILSQQSGLNFIGSQDVSSKRVTLYLNNVPVEEALERILNANNLTYEIQPGSGIFIVKTLDRPTKNLLTKIYRLKHASVSSSKINSTIKIDSSESSSSSSSSSGSAPSASSGGTSSGIVAAVKAVLTSSGTIVEDPRTNSLIITDIPSQFPTIEQTLARLDVSIPQILIEVEMLDVSKSTADLIGVRIGDTPLAFTGAQREHVYPWNQNRLLDKELIDNPSYTVGTITASGLTATLQFLETQTDTKNLARPRILTLNNETAQIKISTNEAVGVVNQTSSSEGSATSSVEAERVETGVFLTVTPQANLLTGEITMAIEPKVIQARDGTIVDPNNGRPFKDPEERGSKSILKVLDGDTIILGGLVRTDNSNTLIKVPILGDIPILGAAFRHKDKGDIQRELIIFITPHIVTEDMKPKSTATNYTPLKREQDIPPTKKREIEKALLIIENQRL